MPLRGPRFSGDPVLEERFAGRHRMLFGEDGIPVKRVQHTLIELGFSVHDGGRCELKYWTTHVGGRVSAKTD
jgi:hypothetical protein